jgi:broad-specificity NMP kinase
MAVVFRFELLLPRIWNIMMGKKNYLIEGVSGTGKTSVCHELRRRGYVAINGDRELAYQGDPMTGANSEGCGGEAEDRHAHHIWDVEKVRRLSADQDDEAIIFCGTLSSVDKRFTG